MPGRLARLSARLALPLVMGGCTAGGGAHGVAPSDAAVTQDAAPVAMPDTAVAADAGAPDAGSAPDARVPPDAAAPVDLEACRTDPAPLAVDAPGRVIPLYLASPDTPPADVEHRRQVYERALTAIQAWYAQAMADHGGETFRFEPVRVLPSHFTRDQWTDFGANGYLQADGTRSDGCGIWYGAEAELERGRVLETMGLPPPGFDDVYYLVVAGGGWGGGCGAGGLAAVEEMLLDRIDHRCPNGHDDGCTRGCGDPGGLGDTDPWCQEWPHDQPGYSCTAVGAFAHEIGHGFGLPHASDRPVSTGRSIMDEWWEYDRGVTLSVQDRDDLAAGRFFSVPGP